MKSESLLVIQPAVTVFSQLLILVSQHRLNLTIRERPVTVSLASGGSLFWWGLAKLVRKTISNRPCSLGRFSLCSGYASQVLPTSPAPPGDSACSSTLSHTTPGPLGSFPFVPLESQVSIFIHSFVPSFIYFIYVLIVIKNPSGCKPCVVCWGSQGK